ncbi:MAG: Hpt domain-containing protein [Isosphaeraceae bacterium]
MREREAGGECRTHVLALTAHAMQGDHERCLEAGFDGYVAKPVRQADLHAALEAIHRPRKVAEHSAIEALINVCGGDDEFARELSTCFLESAPRCLARIEEALRSSDAQTLAEEAHGLNGMSRTIGAESQGLACAELEEAARRGDLAVAAVKAARVGIAWNRLRGELERFAYSQISI